MININTLSFKNKIRWKKKYHRFCNFIQSMLFFRAEIMLLTLVLTFRHMANLRMHC